MWVFLNLEIVGVLYNENIGIYCKSVGSERKLCKILFI